MKKLPQITLTFWIMKICATTLGETAGDLMSMTLDVGYAVSTLVLMGLFVTTLVAQLKSAAPRIWLFWTVILSTSTAGTTLSDYMDRTLELGYPLGSAILLAALVGVLAVWRRSVGTLSVVTIDDRKAEGFYWAAILCSNTLGTAVGDFIADDMGLGFFGGALLVASLIALIALTHFLTTGLGVTLFWAAFVLTRPLGATAGDLLSKSPAQGGLGFGTRGASLVLAAVLIAAVVVQTQRARARPVADTG